MEVLTLMDMVMHSIMVIEDSVDLEDNILILMLMLKEDSEANTNDLTIHSAVEEAGDLVEEEQEAVEVATSMARTSKSNTKRNSKNSNAKD